MARSLLAGVLPQPGLQLPVLAPPDLYLMAPEQALDAAASVSQQPQKLHQQEQHQQIQPQQLQSQQLQSQQEQQQQQAGIAEHAQHSLGYAGEDFTLPPLQGDAGGFPQISVGEHMHVQVRRQGLILQSCSRSLARPAAGWVTIVGIAYAPSVLSPPLSSRYAARRASARCWTTAWLPTSR